MRGGQGISGGDCGGRCRAESRRGRWVRQVGPVGQAEGADTHGRREAGADARAPNGQGKGGIRGRWGTRLIGGPPLSVAGERDAPVRRGEDCSAGLRRWAAGAGEGRWFMRTRPEGERGHGLEGRRGGSGRFLGLGWFWFSYFSSFPFLSFSNSLKLI